MDENTNERLDDYLELFNKIFDKTRDDKVSIAILVEIAKDKRMDQIRQDKEKNGNLPATEKQLLFLEKLGAVIPEELTKREASKLIEQTKQLKDSLKKAIKKPIKFPEVVF